MCYQDLILFLTQDRPTMDKMVKFLRTIRRRGRTYCGRNTAAAAKQRRRVMLPHLAGPDVQEIFNTLTETGDATDYNRAVEALNAYFVPQVNSTFARQTFHQISQKPGETVQQFDCDFGTDVDNQIRDKVLNKCTSTYIKRKLLEEGQGLNLKRTLEVAAQCKKLKHNWLYFR